MAKRTRIIEGTWNCTSCVARDILARFRRCPSCNNPREASGQESEFDFGETDAASGRLQREGVSDDQALAAAQAGVDWFCEYCQASNRGDTAVCQHCHAERSSASPALAEERLPGAAPPLPVRREDLSRVWILLGVGALVCLGGGLGFLYWRSLTHDVPGRVVERAWTHTVRRESFTPVQREGWRDELSVTAARMPVNGQGAVAGVENVRDCARRQRGTREVPSGTRQVCSNKTRRVACGTEEKCTTTKLGNGYARETCEDVAKYCDESYQDCHDETQYRTEPVFDTRCTYDTHEWQQVEVRTLSGRDDPPRWPELAVGPRDRLLREGQYQVRVESTDGPHHTHVLAPGSEAEFLSWRTGVPVTLRVSNGGSVERVLPPTPEGGGKVP